MPSSSSTGDSTEPVTRLVSLAEIQEAHARVLPFVHRTPLLTSSTLDSIATRAIKAKTNEKKIRIRLAFKGEHIQVVGAFKIRGATNAVKVHLERLQGEHGGKFDPSRLCVLTHSSGNHAAAVACAARNVGARAAVVMPRTAPQIKKDAVANYGARIVESEPTQAARESTASALKEELENDGSGTIVRFIHPYDEELVIAGQGTMGLEIVQQAKELQQGRRSCSHAKSDIRGDEDETKAWSERGTDDDGGAALPVLDFVVAPVGGGGMLSGVSTAIKALDNRITVIGAEPEGADDAARSIETGKLQPAISPPRTLCDGLLTALSPRTMLHIQTNVKTILTASEPSMLSALRLVWERMKQIIEPSAAVGLAVVLDSDDFAQLVLERAVERRSQGKQHTPSSSSSTEDEEVEIRIGIVWTGGNVQLDAVVAAMQGS